jgi:hypothetical protein
MAAVATLATELTERVVGASMATEDAAAEEDTVAAALGSEGVAEASVRLKVPAGEGADAASAGVGWSRAAAQATRTTTAVAAKYQQVAQILLMGARASRGLAVMLAVSP